MLSIMARDSNAPSDKGLYTIDKGFYMPNIRIPYSSWVCRARYVGYREGTHILRWFLGDFVGCLFTSWWLFKLPPNLKGVFCCIYGMKSYLVVFKDYFIRCERDRILDPQRIKCSMECHSRHLTRWAPAPLSGRGWVVTFGDEITQLTMYFRPSIGVISPFVAVFVLEVSPWKLIVTFFQ